MHSFHSTLSAVALSVGGLLAVHGAAAADTPEARASHPHAVVRSTTVGYADLDLRRAEGANTLYRRIARAADRVCGPDSRELRAQADRSRCLRDAIAKAVVDVGSPTLAELHAGRTGIAVATPAVIAAR